MDLKESNMKHNIWDVCREWQTGPSSCHIDQEAKQQNKIILVVHNRSQNYYHRQVISELVWSEITIPTPDHHHISV